MIAKVRLARRYFTQFNFKTSAQINVGSCRVQQVWSAHFDSDNYPATSIIFFHLGEMFHTHIQNRVVYSIIKKFLKHLRNEEIDRMLQGYAPCHHN